MGLKGSKVISFTSCRVRRCVSANDCSHRNMYLDLQNSHHLTAGTNAFWNGDKRMNYVNRSPPVVKRILNQGVTGLIFECQRSYHGIEGTLFEIMNFLRYFQSTVECSSNFGLRLIIGIRMNLTLPNTTAIIQ